MRLRFLCLVIVIFGLAVTGCGEAEVDVPDEAAFENERTIGNPAVYERIASLTSCTALQREFDIAYDNVEAREPGDPLREVSRSYGDAADNRMRELGCYG